MVRHFVTASLITPKLRLTIHTCIYGVMLVSPALAGANSAPWNGSYVAEGECFCSGTQGREIDSQIVPTPVGGQSISQVCERVGDGPKLQKVNGKFNFTIYPDAQCGNGPFSVPVSTEMLHCLGHLGVMDEDCSDKGPKWDLKGAYSSTPTVVWGISDTPAVTDGSHYVKPPIKQTASAAVGNAIERGQEPTSTEIAHIRSNSTMITRVTPKAISKKPPETLEQLRAQQLTQLDVARERARLRDAQAMSEKVVTTAPPATNELTDVLQAETNVSSLETEQAKPPKTVFSTAQLFTEEVKPIEPDPLEPFIALSENDFMTENGEVIASVSLRGDVQLSDGIIAYVEGQDLLVPFEQLMFLLEFPIQVFEGNQRASGWFIREERRFDLAVSNGVVTSDGQTYRFDQKALKVIEAELYVSVSQLSKWLPLDMRIDLRALELIIEPREAIAIDEQINRQKRSFGQTYVSYARFPERKTPYQFISVPSLGVDLMAGARNGLETELFNSYSLRADGDLLWSSGSLVVFGDNTAISDARIQLGRENTRGGLLGLLDATQVQAGDVSGASIPLVSKSTAGRGVRIARRPTGFTGTLDTVTVEGPIEPGFEVELYRNDILLDAQNPTGTQYTFEDVLLLGGQNFIRLEFYGTQGQRRTELEQYFVGSGQARVGQLLYDFAVTQPGETVFGVRDLDADSDGEDVTASARIDYGLSTQTSAAVGILHTSVSAGMSRAYVTGGLRSTLGKFFINADTAIDNEGGVATGLGFNRTYDQVALLGRQENYFNDFRSNRNQTTTQRQLASQTSLNITAFTRDLIEDAYVTGAIGGKLAVFDNSESTFDLDFSANVSARSVSAGSNFIFTDIGRNQSVTGRSRVNLRHSEFQARVSADYAVSPETELQQVSFQVTRSFFNGYDTNVGYTHSFQSDNKSAFASATKDLGVASIGITLANHRDTISGDDEKSVTLTFSFNSFTDKSTFRTVTSSNRSGGRGAIAAHVYLDENQNGELDTGEQLLPDVLVRAGAIVGITGPAGRALLVGRGGQSWTDVSIDPDSLADPSWRLGAPGFAILQRPGISAEIDLPVVVTTDIEGIVRLKRGADLSPLSNVSVEVVDASNRVVARGETAYDGLYVIDGVPVGRYVIRIEPAQAERLAIVNPPEIELDLILNSDDGVILGQNFELQRF